MAEGSYRKVLDIRKTHFSEKDKRLRCERYFYPAWISLAQLQIDSGKPEDAIRIPEAPRLDFFLEEPDLSAGELAGVPLWVKSTEGVETRVAVFAQPLGDLPDATPQEVGDVKAVFAGDDPEHRREAFVDAPVVGLVAAAFDFLRLFSVKVNQLHLAPSWAGPAPPRRPIRVAFLREL